MPYKRILICVATLLLQTDLAGASNNLCDLNELPVVKRDNPYEFSKQGYPWRIVVDQLAGVVHVDRVDENASCTIEIQGVRRVYGGALLLALRSIEVTSDDLYFFDPRTCTEVRKAVHLGVSKASQENTAARLKKYRICELLEPPKQKEKN